ncbi:MAG TPA: hypothetical protein VGD24_09055 [Gallionella sp.]
MPHFTDLTGLVGVAVAMTTALPQLPRIARLPQPALAKLLGAFFVLTLIPLGTLPLAGYVRGATGDLSITTQVLLWCALLRPWVTFDSGWIASRRALLLLAALAALFLYPMALGIGMFDPYRMGYGALLFVLALLSLALAAWFFGSRLVTLCIALATLAWALGWHESGNLWDYLLDPFLAIYALGSTLGLALKVLRRRAASRPC